jgi:aminoglycoside 3-N-acetyltransferase
VVRGVHPTHSVSAIGPQAHYLVGDQHLAPSVFGAGSPWDRFCEINGKVLGLGISMGPVTFYHLLEDRLGDQFLLPVRDTETYAMPCRTAAGQTITVPVVPLVPEFLPRRIDNPARKDLRDYFWREFTAAGLLQSGKAGEGRAWYIGARDFYGHLAKLCGEGITIYATPEQLANRPIAP